MAVRSLYKRGILHYMTPVHPSWARIETLKVKLIRKDRLHASCSSFGANTKEFTGNGSEWHVLTAFHMQESVRG